MQYNQSFYRSDNLSDYAKKFLRRLPDDIDIICSSGMSGGAIASAMLALNAGRVLRHIHYYTKGVVSHHSHDQKRMSGDKWSISGEDNDVAFVDDLIDYGSTMLALSAMARADGLKPSIVIVAEFCGRSGARRVCNTLNCPIVEVDRNEIMHPKKERA